jgi:hypothetical protein
MALRVATWLAIAIGGAGGAVAALVSSGNAPAAAPLPLQPLSTIPAHAPGPSAPPTLAAQAPAPSPTAEAALTPTANAEPAASASAAVSATAVAAAPSASARERPPAPPPAADLLPLPTTKEKLLNQEMLCDHSRAESCIVAARSYEGGSAGLTDPEKAAKYRRIALTAWISQCDHNSQVACATLATMYRAGSGVPQSDRNADALFARARDLCRFNDAPVCHELPTP